MTAATDPVAHAAAEAWAMLAVRRAGLAADEPSAPFAVAFDRVLDATGGDRPAAFRALRTAAAESLEAAGAKLPGKLYGNPAAWAGDARSAVYLIGACGLCGTDLMRSRMYLREMHDWLCVAAGTPARLTANRAWLGWVGVALVASFWLNELARMCEG